MPDTLATGRYEAGCDIYGALIEKGRSSDEPWGALHGSEREQMDEVMRLWEAAAKEKHAGALLNLGALYCHSHGVEQDFQKAIELFTASAELGSARARR